MSRIPHPRRLRRKAIVGLAGVAFLASGSLAVAQIAGQPDGSPGGAQQPNVTTLRCGPLSREHRQDRERAERDQRGQLPAAPGREHPDRRAARTRAVASRSCSPPRPLAASAAPHDLCYIRALDGAIRARPERRRLPGDGLRGRLGLGARLRVGRPPRPGRAQHPDRASRRPTTRRTSGPTTGRSTSRSICRRNRRAAIRPPAAPRQS